MKPRILRNLVLISAASLGLAACTDGYGYGGVGYGYGGYYNDYYDGGYYGSPYYGWYDGWYYPGTGYYVFDNRGTRRRWDDGQRRYWEGRRHNREANPQWRGSRDGTWNRERWNRDGSGNRERWNRNRTDGEQRPLWRSPR